MINPVSYRDILDAPNAKELLEEYSIECSIPEIGRANPQPELYDVLENSGGFQAFGVYRDDKLIGFATVLIYVLPHYGKKVATTESIFISIRYRSGGEGIELLNFIEDYARSMGCSAFLYSAPSESRFDRLLSLRYRHTNNVYLRKLV